jgi:hypothetical protein
MTNEVRNTSLPDGADRLILAHHIGGLSAGKEKVFVAFSS